MKFIPMLTLFCLMISGIVSAQTTEGTMERYTLTHDDRERDYLVYTPADYDESQSYSLLLALHPANTTAQDMASMTNFNSLADTYDVLMVFPNSVSGRWNSSEEFAFDDVGFISALLDTLIADYSVDDSQVFVLGYSSGGLMTMKLRCALADRLTGIISYAAPMTFAIASDCLSADPVSAFVIHGTVDEVFPYGGQASVSNGELSGTFSAVQTIGFLASLNGCESQAQTKDISAENTRNPVYAKSYPCDDTVTQLYTIAGLGHFGWAGQLGVTVDGEDITLNDAIFRFIITVRGQS
jgi:polyhydroxybutyrate depolymerase